MEENTFANKMATILDFNARALKLKAVAGVMAAKKDRIKVEAYAQTKEMVEAIRRGRFVIVVKETPVGKGLSRVEATFKRIERPGIFSRVLGIFGPRVVMK